VLTFPFLVFVSRFHTLQAGLASQLLFELVFFASLVLQSSSIEVLPELEEINAFSFKRGFVSLSRNLPILQPFLFFLHCLRLVVQVFLLN